MLCSKRAGVFGVVCALSLAAAACSGSQQEASGGAQLEILFPQMYSAVTDGSRDFKVPATVNGVKGVKWSSSDSSMVKLEPDSNGTDVMIHPLKPGTVTIFAKAGSLSGSAPLTISQFQEQDWMNGSARYNDGVVFMHHDDGDGGMMDHGPHMPDPMLACTNCHNKGGADVEHTPMQTGGYSDDDLVNIFTKGVKPAGVPQRIWPFDRWHRVHQWQMTDDEKHGLIVYLRALEPKAQGPVDFGGHHH